MIILAKSNKGKAQGAKRKSEDNPKSGIENMEQEEDIVKKIDIDIDLSEDNPAESASDTPAETLDDKLGAERDKYLRLAAEYDNFRKRSKLERETAYRDARTDAITRLLPVYDNLERALKMECSDEAFYKGIEMTMTGLTEILEGMDIKPIDAVGEPFDPNKHNAVMTIENPELGEKIVAEEFQKGFMLGEKVIRFSTVIVAN